MKTRVVSLDRILPEPRVHRMPVTPMEALMSSGPFEEIPSSRLEFDRLATLVGRAVGSLEPLDQDIVIARVYERLTFREIADRFEISKSNAHWRYSRSLTNVRTWLTSWAHTTAGGQAPS